MRFRHSNNKGQAALEYMVTYGWALIAIAAAIGVLFYFGLLDFNRYVPDSCDFGEQLKCEQFAAYNGNNDGGPINDPTVQVVLRNNFEQPIYIASVTDTEGDIDTTNIPLTIGVGQTDTIEITYKGDTATQMIDGRKMNFDMVIEYQRDDGLGPTTEKHDLAGTVFTTILDEGLKP